MGGKFKIEPHRIIPGKESEFFEILDGALDVGVSIMDADYKYLYLNKSAANVLQLRESDFAVGDSLNHVHELMVQKGLVDRGTLSNAQPTNSDLNTFYAREDDASHAMVSFKDGRTHKLTRRRTANGYTVSLNQDVTDLIKKDELLHSALVLGDAGYWVYDFATKKTEISSSMKGILSAGELELIKKHGILAVIHKDCKPEFRKAMVDIRKNDDSVVYVHKNLTGERWYRTTGKAERDENGKLLQLRAFVKEITNERRQAEELKRVKDEAVAANVAKSEFLANMSHEIRTPMNGVLGMAELLEETDIDERQREFIKVITRSSNALLTIINDILDFSKIEAGAFELDPLPFDLRDSINDVASLMLAKSQEKGLEMIVNYPLDMETAFVGDGSRLRQVITNLLGNAIKFTDQGHVTIDVGIHKYTNSRAQINISVSDTGIGIEADKLERVFEKFTQADNSTTRVYGGTGLGLSISRRIIELMGGKITARSIAGKGSTFSVSLPMKIDTSRKKAPRDLSGLQGLRALIVDDVSINRNILTERLGAWGMKTAAVKSGIEALSTIKAANAAGQSFDVILLDYLMPEMNGQELAAILSTQEMTKGIPILMLSSSGQSIPSADLLRIGVSSYLVKPVRERQLFKQLTNLLAGNSELTASPQNPASGQMETADRYAAPSKINLLVAEDFALNQDVVRLMLQSTEYEPIFTNNGREALAAYQKNPEKFSGVLMDISMPVMDGYQASKAILAHQTRTKLPPIPIIALTGHALKGDREKCLAAGMHEVLTKPVKYDELMRVLNVWVKGGYLQQMMQRRA